jgi:hypothetical protein
MKYTIEGDIDFYKELLNSSDDENEIIEENDCCMITNMPLQENYVKLKCGHQFNYGAIFKDLVNYKKKFNNLEQIKYKLKQNEIRCPYCRKIQNELLPYYENLSYPKEYGVNCLDVNNNYKPEYLHEHNQCKHENTIFDNSGNVLYIQKCFKYGYYHNILKDKYNITNKYCYDHKQVLVKEIKYKEQMKIKEQKLKIKEEKLKIKEEIKKMKEENKKKELENKKMEKQSNKNKSINNNNNNNNVLSYICCAIIKTGERKGLYCSIKSYKDCLCKRHYNIKNKDINNTSIIS